MNFVSYAQNLEDVVLWRALRHVGEGFYIDVGANDPVDDSVTRGFYDCGWRGINIEPVATHHAALAAARPRDINLAIALGEREGTVELHVPQIRGLATLSAGVAQGLAEQNIGTTTCAVPMRTLAAVCGQFAPPAIHFLKIDVEGYERQVLEGADFSRFRPWVLVVESTFPNSNRPSHEEWEKIVLDAGYVYAYFDGINRFYAAREHGELLPALGLPPNVHDAYTFRLREGHYFSFPTESLRERIAELEQGSTRLQGELLAANAAALAARATAESARGAQAALRDVYASRSWRLTAPLRWCSLQAALLRERGLRARMRALLLKALRPLARRLAAQLKRRPRLGNALLGATLRLGLHPLARRVYARLTGAAVAADSAAALPPRALQIADTLQAMVRSQGGRR